MQNKTKRIASLLLAGLIIIGAVRLWLLSTSGEKFLNNLTTVKQEDIWPKNRITVRSSTQEIMGTFAQITVVAMNEQTANESIKKAFMELEKNQKTFDWRLKESQIAHINRLAFEKPLEVSKEVFDLIKFSTEISEISNSSFDITVGPVIDLWKNAEQTNKQPTPQQIQHAKSLVGYYKLNLNTINQTIQFEVDGMRLDMGGVAKGFGIDKAIESLKKNGAIGGLVDVGGDIRCFGAPPKSMKAWVIGLQNPQKTNIFANKNNVMTRFKLLDYAVATSGDYRRFTVIQGEKQSHIIDPVNSKGAKAFSSVSIFSRDAKTADALATAVSVMGPDEGLKLVESLIDTEALLITNQPEFKIIQSTGLNKFLE